MAGTAHRFEGGSLGPRTRPPLRHDHIDPETAARNPAILGNVTKAHEGKAGVYGAVLIEGMVRIGDEIEVLD